MRLLVASALITFSASCMAFNTGKDLVIAGVMYDAWRSAGKPMDGSNASYQAMMYMMYVNGAAGALHSTREICIPSGTTMYSIDDAALAYFDRNAERVKTMSGALAVTSALKETYQCN